MSKIICDVCGTSYPDTANQCPICGCVRTPENKKINDEAAGKKSNSTYTYVKGGRFSKSNVRKRMKSGDIVSVNVVNDGKKTVKKQDNGGNRGLVTVVIILLLAIVATALYITARYFVPTFVSQENPTETTATTETIETTEATVPCTEIMIDTTVIQFSKIGDVITLTAEVAPADTTDVIEFVSADESIAKVAYEGNVATVTAVAEGTTTITVKCGDCSAVCTVECVVADATDATDDTTEATESGETTDPTGDTEATEPSGESETTNPSETTAPAGGTLTFNREDFTLTQWNETWILYTGDIPAELITWTSDNPQIATIENGVVRAVGVGMTMVHAEYNGQKISCIVRCSF